MGNYMTRHGKLHDNGMTWHGLERHGNDMAWKLHGNGMAWKWIVLERHSIGMTIA
jgi:hypothetical protein